MVEFVGVLMLNSWTRYRVVSDPPKSAQCLLHMLEMQRVMLNRVESLVVEHVQVNRACKVQLDSIPELPHPDDPH